MSKKSKCKPVLKALFPEGFRSSIPPCHFALVDAPIDWQSFGSDVPIAGNVLPHQPGDPPFTLTMGAPEMVSSLQSMGAIKLVVHAAVMALLSATTQATLIESAPRIILPVGYPRLNPTLTLAAVVLHATLDATRQTVGDEGVAALRLRIHYWLPEELRPLLWRKTGKDLMSQVLWNIDPLLRGPVTMEAVAVFDKGEYVPSAKEVERSKRRKYSNKVTPLAWDGKATIIAMNRWVPPWSSVNVSHRTRYAAMQQFTDMLCVHYTPPLGKRLIIDGGKGGFGGVARGPPLCIENVPPMTPNPEAPGTYLPQGRRVIECPEYYNEIGEADMSLYFHAHRYAIQRPGCNTQVASKDTDVAMLAIFHAATRRDHATGEFGSQLYVKVGSKKTPEGTYTQEYIDVNALCRSIESKMSHLRWPVESLVAACYVCGNDYVDGYTSLTPERILNAYFTNHRNIGDLIDMNNPIPGDSVASVSICPRAYQRLLKWSYQSLQAKTLGSDPGVTWQEVKDTVAERNAKRTTWHVPPDTLIHARYTRLTWNIHYSVTAPFGEPIPSEFGGNGWRLINPALPPVDNVALDNDIFVPVKAKPLLRRETPALPRGIPDKNIPKRKIPPTLSLDEDDDAAPPTSPQLCKQEKEVVLSFWDGSDGTTPVLEQPDQETLEPPASLDAEAEL